MKTHVNNHLSSIKRRVSFTERDGKPAASVILSRQFGVEPDVLWNAITSRKRISSWFSPITGKLELGGSYEIEGNAHGVINACEALTRVSLTWEFAGDVSWVDLHLESNVRSSVSFELNHTAILSPHWDQYGAGATGVGWETSYLALFLHLLEPEQLMFDEEAFAASEDGKGLVSASSMAWAEASILAGADPEAAKAAAERTRAFYLGL